MGNCCSGTTLFDTKSSSFRSEAEVQFVKAVVAGKVNIIRETLLHILRMNYRRQFIPMTEAEEKENNNNQNHDNIVPSSSPVASNGQNQHTSPQSSSSKAKGYRCQSADEALRRKAGPMFHAAGTCALGR